MSDPFVRDDVLEAVLRSRAGDGVPPDLRGSILAAVAADGPRVGPRRRSASGRPWRLLAVAAVLLGTIGTALFVGGSRHADDPQPSRPAVVPNVSPSPSPSPDVDLYRSGSATPSGVTTVTTTVPTGNCAVLQADAQQAGVTGGPWTVGQRGPATAVTNGLIAVSGAVGSNTLRLVDPASGKSTKLPTFGSDGAAVIGWSPTGAALAFDVAVGEGFGTCTGLFVWSSSGVVEVAIQRGGFDGAIWSPTGSALAYVGPGSTPDGTSHMLLAASDGSAPRNLGPICGEECSFLDTPIWSPDGARIAFSWLTADQSDSRLSILNVASGTSSVVPQSAGYRLDDGGFTPASGLSRWLDASTLLLGTNHGYATIALDKPGTPATRVAWPPAQFGTISPDLKWWTDLGCFSCTLTVTSRASGRTHTLWDSTATNVAWAPDSKQLVVSVGSEIAKPGLWVINVDGSGRHRITSTAAGNVDWQPVWP